MADVELVIEIDENIAQGIIDGENDTPRNIVRNFQATIAVAIKNGTLLPKGHGKIVDANRVLENGDNWEVETALMRTEAIIEADKVERSDKE